MHLPSILPRLLGALLAGFCITSVACQPPEEGRPAPLFGRDLARAEFPRANAVFVARVTSYRDEVHEDMVTTNATLVPTRRFKGDPRRFLRHHSNSHRAMDCTSFRTITEHGYYIYFGSLIDDKPVFLGALRLHIDENGKFESSSAKLIEEFATVANTSANNN